MKEPKPGTTRLVSWNLLHSRGAVVDDVAALIETQRPDLMVMQEVTSAMDTLPDLVGGRYMRQDWPGRLHGLAAWSRDRMHGFRPLPLPASRLPGSFPMRFAQLLRTGDVIVANVHLSHGQLLNRRQLQHIARCTWGPTAILGDFNSFGPTRLRGFGDIGPRGNTHRAQQILPFRLDRCLGREIEAVHAARLHRGSSDHRPILVDLQPSG